MLKPTLIRSHYKIKGNEHLLADEPEKIWVVQSGTLALFATKIDRKEATGNRRYLFSISAGEALFGINLWQDIETDSLPPYPVSDSQYGILAVAIEESELLQLDMADVAKEVAAGEIAVISLLENWINRLTQLIAVVAIAHPDQKIVISGSGQQKFPPEQALQTSGKAIVWLQVKQGSLAWMGEEKLILDPASPSFPLSALTWLKAVSAGEILTTPTAFQNEEELRKSLAFFHNYTCWQLQAGYKQKIEAEFQQFQQLEQLNIQVTEGALDSLAAAFKRQQPYGEEGTPLLIAAGAVGRAIGITIRPPVRSQNSFRRDPVEAIALASRIRTRRVILTGKWWQEEHGPLLAFTQDNRPVALLVDKSKGYRYVLFDPELRTRTLVDHAIADNLIPEAYMFYRPLPSVINKAFEVFQFGVKGYEIDLLKIMLVGVIGTLLGMVTPQATAILINNVIPNGYRLVLFQIALGLLAVSFGQTTFNFSQGLIAMRVSNGINSTLQTAIWDRLLRLSPSLIRQFTTGDLLVRIMSITQIYSLVSGATQRTLLSGLFSLLNLGLMFFYSLPLTLVGLALTLIAVILTVTSGLILLGKQRQQEQLSGEIQGLMVQLINGVPKLRVGVAEERAFAAWAKKYSQQNQLNLEIIRINDIVSVFNELLSLASSILLYWFGFAAIHNPAAGQEALTLGIFLAFNSAFGTFFGGVTSLSNTLTDIIQIAPLWERAQPILQGKLEVDSQKADPGILTGRVVLDQVEFRYRQDGPLVLDHVSIHADPGEFIAIVGPSGSGKSTLFRLLLGFETPVSGKVYYDGQDLSGLDLPALRRQLGVVLQNGRVMQGSIFTNVTGGALVSMNEAWEAAKMAGFTADIQQMPMGMHTVVSEGGSNLSGGQRQRLLIARSLIFKPQVILLDEATSFLDNRTQAIVTESLEKLNVTRIVIAHRLSSIQHADRIYVMEAGRIVQVGSFEELIKQQGLFSRLVARQL